MIDRHHLLECILWPNSDGTFRKIVNTEDRLRELGIYDDYKLTIPIEHGSHTSMHNKFKMGTEYEFSGENTSLYGKTGEMHPSWKGSRVGPKGVYRRALELYKSGQITEEELQPFRDVWAEEQRKRKKRM